MASRGEFQYNFSRDTRPCKLFNSASGCMMTRCDWLHVRSRSTDPPSCIYFRTSGCKFGDECLFLHSYPSQIDHLDTKDVRRVRHYNPGEVTPKSMLYFADFHSDPVGRDDGATEEEEEEDGRIPAKQEEDYPLDAIVKCVCCQAAFKNDDEGLEALATHYTKKLSTFCENHLSAFDWPELANLSALCVMCERSFSRAVHFWKHVVMSCRSGHRMAKMHTDLRNEIINDFVGYSQEQNNKLFFESMKVNMVGKPVKNFNEKENRKPMAVRNLKICVMDDDDANLENQAKEYEDLERLYFWQ